MRLRFALLLMSVTALLALPLASARAQVGVVTAVVAGKQVKDIIRDLQSAMGTTLALAQNRGDALALSASSTASVTAANVAAIFAKELDRKVRDLEPTKQQLLQRAYDLSQAINNATASATSLEQALNLDIRGILGSLGGEKLYIDRIAGITQIQRNDQYLIGVDGVGVGAVSQDRRPSLSLSVKGKQISAMVNPTAATGATIIVPAAELAPYFESGKLNIVPATLVADLQYKSGLIFKRWKRTRIETPFFFALLPKDAGSVAAEQTLPRHGWVTLPAGASNTVTTGDHHCSSNCRNEPTRTTYLATLQVSGGNGKVGDQRLVGLTLECTSGSCAFSKKGELAMDRGNSIARWPFDVWSRPTTWIIRGAVQEWRVIGDTTRTTDLPLRWAEDTTLRVPQEATFLRIRGTLIGNIPVDFAVDNPASSDLLSVIQQGTAGTDKVYQIRLRAPKGIVTAPGS